MWISIRNELPPESEDVLLFREDGSCVVASLEDFYDAESGHFVMKIKETEAMKTEYSEGLELDGMIEVTHWMPLPKDPPLQAQSTTVDVQLLNALNTSLEILSKSQAPFNDNSVDDVLHREATRKVKASIVKLLTHEVIVSCDGDGACTGIERGLAPNRVD